MTVQIAWGEYKECTPRNCDSLATPSRLTSPVLTLPLTAWRFSRFPSFFFTSCLWAGPLVSFETPPPDSWLCRKDTPLCHSPIPAPPLSQLL